MWIIIPEHKNNKDLNIACVIKWNNVNFGKFIEIVIIINPNWLKVDKAIIFFKSYSKFAVNPAINIVIIDKINKKYIKFLFIKWLNRINKYTPAVTNVEEWTNAEIGVGAVIAIGNHVEKGIWALFVIDAIKIKYIINIFNLFIMIKFNDPKYIINPIDKIIIISPTRFIKIVIILELNLFLFL